MTRLPDSDHALLPWGRGALLRGSPAGHGWPAEWARTTLKPPPPTGPATTLSVWLKKSATLSRTQKHRRASVSRGGGRPRAVPPRGVAGVDGGGLVAGGLAELRRGPPRSLGGSWPTDENLDATSLAPLAVPRPPRSRRSTRRRALVRLGGSGSDLARTQRVAKRSPWHPAPAACLFARQGVVRPPQFVGRCCATKRGGPWRSSSRPGAASHRMTSSPDDRIRDARELDGRCHSVGQHPDADLNANVGAGALRTRVRQAQADNGTRPNMLSEECEEIRKLGSQHASRMLPSCAGGINPPDRRRRAASLLVTASQVAREGAHRRRRRKV